MSCGNSSKHTSSCGKPSLVTRDIKSQNNSIGRDGESAYQTYLRLGGTLTEAAWLISLKGEKGDGINIKGSVKLYSELANIEPIPALGDSWIVDETGMMYVYGTTGFPDIDDGIVIKGDPGNNYVPMLTTDYFESV